MSNHDLGGHSGCKVILIEKENNGYFVRKISKNHEYNSRLKEQCHKQKNFDKKYIKAPKVIDEGYTNEGLFYFDMEYVRGVTLDEYIKGVEVGKIDNLVSNIVESIMPKQSSFEYIYSAKLNKIFQTKIKSLKDSVDLSDETIYTAVNYLESHDWSWFEKMDCHGDMTLENIIIKNDDLYFIDFLDSFHDSWLMDLGTLLQDVQTLWSYRFLKEIDMNTIIRLKIFKDLLVQKIHEKNNHCVIELYYALLQKLVRIIPYTTDQFTYDFLLKKIKMVVKIIDSFNGGNTL